MKKLKEAAKKAIMQVTMHAMDPSTKMDGEAAAVKIEEILASLSLGIRSLRTVEALKSENF